MQTAIKQITMERVDFDSIAESQENHESVEFEIVLSETPNQKWIDEFQIAYLNQPFNIKPPVQVVGDRLRIAYIPRYDRELQSYVDFLKQILLTADDELQKTLLIAERGNKHAELDQFRQDLLAVRLK